jgi:hypothetical protein
MEDIESTRLNIGLVKENVRFDKLEALGRLFESKKVLQNIKMLKGFIYDPARSNTSILS